MIPEMPPQRSAEPGFAPSTIIERAAQHLDWTIAFGMRHNSLRGLEETTNQQMRPDPPGIAVAGLRCGPAGKRRLLFTLPSVSCPSQLQRLQALASSC